MYIIKLGIMISCILLPLKLSAFICKLVRMKKEILFRWFRNYYALFMYVRIILYMEAFLIFVYDWLSLKWREKFQKIKGFGPIFNGDQKAQVYLDFAIVSTFQWILDKNQENNIVEFSTNIKIFEIINHVDLFFVVYKNILYYF